MNQFENTTEKVTSLSDFAAMDDLALEKLRRELGLSMSEVEFRACRTYYRQTNQPAPQADEIQLLDSIVVSGSRVPESLCITEMKTESKLIAEIFSDLMARRNAIMPDLNRPVSLPELIGVMESYLDSSTQTNPLSEAAIRFTSYRNLLLTGQGYLLTASTGSTEKDISIGTKPPRAAFDGGAVKPGDYIFAVLKSKNPDRTFENRLAEYLSCDTVRRCAKKVSVLCEDGLINTLMKISDGMLLDTNALLGGIDTSLSDLTAPASGVLLTASPALSADMLLLAQDMDLHVIRAATVTAGKNMCIPTKNGKTVTFSFTFLNSLVLPRVYSATVETPNAKKPKISLTKIGTCTLNGKKHAVVKADASGNKPFASSLFGVLYAMLHCFAAGASPEEMGLACHLTLPRPSPSRIGESLSSILGLYRMQAEFELHGNTPTITQGTGAHPLLSIALLASLPNTPISPTLTGGGSKIFYLEPLYTEEEIPDFADLKKMLEYIKKLHSDGHILSILPTTDNLAESFAKMRKNTTTEFLRHKLPASRYGGLLVESDINIQGTLIAQTEKPEPIAPVPSGE